MFIFLCTSKLPYLTKGLQLLWRVCALEASLMVIKQQCYYGQLFDHLALGATGILWPCEPFNRNMFLSKVCLRITDESSAFSMHWCTSPSPKEFSYSFSFVYLKKKTSNMFWCYITLWLMCLRIRLEGKDR